MTRLSPATLAAGLIVAWIAVAGVESATRLLVLRQALFEQVETRGAASLSADGQFVAFVSTARLLPADSNDMQDIYVFDRLHETLTLETLAPDGSASNGGSGSPELSADARLLVFDSDATNLIETEDGNRSRDVFVRDRLGRTTRRLSVTAAGHEADHMSLDPSISADGRTVAFASRATNLAAGLDASRHQSHVYVVRLASGEIRRITVGTDRPTDQTIEPNLSGDGRVLAFASTARLGPAWGPSVATLPLAVFVFDLMSGTMTCLSCDGPGHAFDPQVSEGGGVVAFTRTAATGASPRRSDVVVYDRTSTVVSVITRAANASSRAPRITGDGRFLVFESEASNLECAQACSPQVADENLLPDIYEFDREARTFKRLSGRPATWWAPSVGPLVDASGRVLVFSSRQPVGPEDATTDFDLFILLTRREGTGDSREVKNTHCRDPWRCAYQKLGTSCGS